VTSSLAGFVAGEELPDELPALASSRFLGEASEHAARRLPPRSSSNDKGETDSTASSETGGAHNDADDGVVAASSDEPFHFGMHLGGWNGWPPLPHDAHAYGYGFSGYGPECWPYSYVAPPPMYMGPGVAALPPQHLEGASALNNNYEPWPADMAVDDFASVSAAPCLPPPPPDSPMLGAPAAEDDEIPAPPEGLPVVTAPLTGPLEPPPGIKVPVHASASEPGGARVAPPGAGACPEAQLSFDKPGAATMGALCGSGPPALSRALSTQEGASPPSMVSPPMLSRARSSPAGPSPPQPPTITTSVHRDGGTFRVQWIVDARKLKVKDKVAVSPPFELCKGVPGTFRIMLYPTVVSDRKGGASFKKAKGKGSVQIKCESPLDDVYDGIVTLRILVCGLQQVDSGAEEAPRGPVQHNFADSGVCSLPKDQEEWDFGKATDEETQNFVVLLEVLDPSHEAA